MKYRSTDLASPGLQIKLAGVSILMMFKFYKGIM